MNTQNTKLITGAGELEERVEVRQVLRLATEPLAI